VDFLNEFYFQAEQQANQNNKKLLEALLLGRLTKNE